MRSARRVAWGIAVVALAALATPPPSGASGAEDDPSAPTAAWPSAFLPPLPVLLSPPLPSGHVTAFVDVSVAAMTTPLVAPHQTVIVVDKAIVAVGPAKSTAVPSGATVVDGRGKFLIPGLHDMHVHLDYTHGMLELFVGAGVTTVRNMAGSPRTVALKHLVADGQVVGPTIYTAGPFVDGAQPRWEASASVVTPTDAERVLDDHVAVGYDFVKIYNGLTAPAYDAVLAAAAARGLRCVGHVPFAVTLDHALAAGQASIEHLFGFADALERADSPVRHVATAPGVIKRWMYADLTKLPELAARVVRSGAYNTPTLVTAVTYGDLYRGKTPDEAGDLDAISPDWRARWDPKRSPRHYADAIRRAMEQAHDKSLATEMAIVAALSHAGAPLLAGTDTPNPYVVPGASLHHELALFVAAGLTPYAALRAATVDAGIFLHDSHDGVIATGAHADLVLLDGDPLADIHALDRIAGVMVHGRWLAADELKARRDQLVAGYREPAWTAPVELAAGSGSKVVQYVVADNGAPVGAYALARHGDTLIERETLEDDATSARVVYKGARASELAIDVARIDGVTHAEYRAGKRRLLPWLTPATAYELVAPLARQDANDAKRAAAAAAAKPAKLAPAAPDAGSDADEPPPAALDEATSAGASIDPAPVAAAQPIAAIAFSVDTPDVDVPGALVQGALTISRLPSTHPEDRSYRIRLVLGHVAQVARISLSGDGLPRKFTLSSTTRPLVRTWRRRK